MILGIGLDVIETERIAKALERSGFIKRILSADELESLGSKANIPEHVAGRFAAKEAVVKALGTGIGSVGFLDIEIHNSPGGQPEVRLRGAAEQLGLGSVIHLSITHIKSVTAAMAIIEEVSHEGRNRS